MNNKINILVVPSDRFGVGRYRSIAPHVALNEQYGNDFDIDINYSPDWSNLESFKKYDIVHFHKGLYKNMEIFWNALRFFKSQNIVTVMDIDDNWEVGPQHPLYLTNKSLHASEKIIENIKLSDYVTTTTPIFAEKIKKYNKNVFVFPNGVNPNEEQYSPNKNKSDRLRVGFVMGSAHEKDMEQIKGVSNILKSAGILDKIQFVLCGFDLRGSITIMDKNGNVTGQRPVKPLESVWYSYEKTVTDNYNIVSPEYKEFLLKFLPGVQWPMINNEPYRREWTKDVNEFAKHYRNLDVLLAPLNPNNFNLVKSELKFIEGGFTRTAVIASNFGPYTIGSKNLFKKGGEIDMEGNCILIDENGKAKDWAKAIKKLVERPELVSIMTNNMYNTVKDKYDIRNITNIRASWYKDIIKK